ncbi:ATPase [Paenibacillus baekrokdamisoli]|uniref:ATPase n=1 Tax=Paenibacillus baekrokdamisoli TaxID=1712516 RepID=A0A3G9JGQ4_9BACL|nr:AAA family ATPase [Paenibacillus baekrokdamisoli]MBB3070774.1 dephospho-CoA kinase [Paenibacillus baekrokdamisoli]BBH22284.1 ATPase [Paenibacillus baekrokdamisoli]
MRKLIFVLGGAGAGKTTVAKALAHTRRAALFDMDTLLRPAAEAIMTQAGLDPNDRDSATYKRLCRDLGYRITMDAALENIAIGTDAIVIGPFTQETEDPLWLENELAAIGATMNEVEVKVVVVHLQDEQLYQQRIEARSSVLDRWKLDNWSQFRRSLTRREIKWNLATDSILYFDNSGMLSEERLTMLERFIYGNE